MEGLASRLLTHLVDISIVSTLVPEKPPQVVVEDYVHTNRIKMPTVVAIQLRCFALAVAGIHRHITHCLRRI
jgi:hypothetical protein